MSDGDIETLGKISLDLMSKTPDSRDPIEIERELHSEYEKNIYECMACGKKGFDSNFYIVVTTKKEPLLKNVLRNYFFSRRSCPTPDYDQTVYQYIKSDDHIKFLWVLPSKDTCELLRDHALEVVPEERGLRDFVLSFYDGSILRLSKKLNNEMDDSNIIIGAQK